MNNTPAVRFLLAAAQKKYRIFLFVRMLDFRYHPHNILKSVHALLPVWHICFQNPVLWTIVFGMIGWTVLGQEWELVVRKTIVAQWWIKVSWEQFPSRYIRIPTPKKLQKRFVRDTMISFPTSHQSESLKEMTISRSSIYLNRVCNEIITFHEVRDWDYKNKT